MPRKGQVNDRTGEHFVNNQGCSFFIVEYNNRHDVWIQFEDEFGAIVHTQYNKCLDGGVNNPYHKTVCGLGYLGLMKNGEKPITRVNGKDTREVVLWRNLIRRCSDSKKYPSYRNCSICERWYCFANFLEDLPMIEGYELWKNSDGYELDKDLKQVGVANKVYSVDTTCFIDKKLNVKERIERGGVPKKKRSVIVHGYNKKTNQSVTGNLTDIAEMLNLDKSNIIGCCRGRVKPCGGYTWEYVGDTNA